MNHVGEWPASAVFTCTGCGFTYEPAVEDLDAGRTGCPDPDCGGWMFWAELVVPAAGRDARKSG